MTVYMYKQPGQSTIPTCYQLFPLGHIYVYVKDSHVWPSIVLHNMHVFYMSIVHIFVYIDMMNLNDMYALY